MLKIAVVLCTLTGLLCSCSPSPRYTVDRIKKEKSSEKLTAISPEEIVKPPPGTKMRGLASFYAHDFHNKRTANGEIYDMNGLTAAHRTLQFNTWLEVTNLSNGRTVIVRVNDRGPFIEDRIIDLSQGAAKELRMEETGVQEVEIEILR